MEKSLDPNTTLLLNYFTQPHKLIYTLICLHAALTFEIVHRRRADRILNHLWSPSCWPEAKRTTARLPITWSAASNQHPDLPWICWDAIWRSAFSAFDLYTRPALLNGSGFAFQGLFHQTFGLVAHLLFWYVTLSLHLFSAK
jgi:hypothetical protein